MRELSGPAEVGKTYAVPCVRLSEVQAPPFVAGWYPIFGAAHSDPELLTREPHASALHWHLDSRFLSDYQFARIVRFHSSPFAVVVWQMDGKFMSHYDDDQRPIYRFTGPELRPRKCLRPWPWQLFPESDRTILMKRLHRYANRSLPECRRCPHRNFDLSQVAPDERGIIQCPGHGLRWWATTGEPVPPDVSRLTVNLTRSRVLRHERDTP